MIASSYGIREDDHPLDLEYQVGVRLRQEQNFGVGLSADAEVSLRHWKLEANNAGIRTAQPPRPRRPTAIIQVSLA